MSSISGDVLKLCRFDIFGITETHLKSEIADGEIGTENYNFIRGDRPERQGGGCIIYYRKSLKIIHRSDLEEDKVEGICMQVKAGTRDTMLGIMYRPPNQTNEIFLSVSKTAGKNLDEVFKYSSPRRL